jgi:glycosyltransferase involved in cell wall biosynthesis
MKQQGCSSELRRVVFVCGRDGTGAGTAGTYVAELFRAARESECLDPFLVWADSGERITERQDRGAHFARAGRDDREYILSGFDEGACLPGSREKDWCTRDWSNFLGLVAPDVIHLHHSPFLGADLIRQARRQLPRAAVISTFHDYSPMCLHSGRMVLTGSFKPCSVSSPRRCHSCFPNVSVEDFFLRDRLIRATIEMVDLFITPSQFVRERFVEWGVPRDRIVVEENGRCPVRRVPEPANAGRRRRIGFFGPIAEHSGLEVLLEAVQLLAAGGIQVHLLLAGSTREEPLSDGPLGDETTVIDEVNTESEVATDAEPPGVDDDFHRRVGRLLDDVSGSVNFFGPYTSEELPSLLSAVDWVIFPSVAPEASPAIIQDAFSHRRPLICTDAGAAEEKIEPGINGLCFHAGSPRSLADTIGEAVGSPELWDRLCAAQRDPHPMADHLRALSAAYEKVLSRAVA